MRVHSAVTGIVAGVILLFLSASSTSADVYSPPPNHRKDFNFNYDWKYIKGDIAHAAAEGFDDSGWETVSLPHTCNDDKFREWISTRNDKIVSRPYTGYMWYRKSFSIKPADSDRKFILEFQGITLVGKAFVNGKEAGLHESGVGPCGIDITSLVHPGRNVVAVQVDNNPGYKTVNYHGAKLPFGEPFNPNFGGINKDVVLHMMDKTYQTLPLYSNLGTLGPYVYSSNFDMPGRSADLTIESEVKNDSGNARQVSVEALVVDRGGSVVLSLPRASQSLVAGEKAVFHLTGRQSGIHFWSPEYPYLYSVYTILKVNDEPVDVVKTSFGVRQFTFTDTHGLEVNGRPIYLKGFAPRTSMEWPCVGVPVDWMNELDFQLIKQCHGNLVRPMHIAPYRSQVEAGDKFGIVMVVPAANNEGHSKEADIWQERLDDMRDVTIYFRNNPSVLFYEGCNQILSADHMADMKKIRLTYDPHGGRFAGLRSNDRDVTENIREYSCSMDGAGYQPQNPMWDAEYARGESPRRVWDEYTPMLNPRWDGKDPSSKYVTGGYFAIASDYHRSLGLNSGNGDFIGDYFHNGKIDVGYFRLQSSEDMVLENLAKYYARYARSPFVQSPEVCASKGIMVGGAKIIWSDSVTDGRMRDMEVARVSGAVDGVRLPKEVYYGLQVAHNTQPQVYVVGHWNYPPGTVKRVYVVSNTAKVKLQLYDQAGRLVKDYGFGRNDFAAPKDDQVNHYVYAFENVAWAPGTIKAVGCDESGREVAEWVKSTSGKPTALKITPIVGPSGHWLADGSDVAMFDVEVLDAMGYRCATYEDRVDFNCTGNGVFLGGYNSGIRDSTNLEHLTSGYHLNLECGVNRVFVRATRTAGEFVLNVTGANLSPASARITSVPIELTDGMTLNPPQKYEVELGQEPEPRKPDGDEGNVSTTGRPHQSREPVGTDTSADKLDVDSVLTNVAYSGNHPNAELAHHLAAGAKVYLDSDAVYPELPAYLGGADYILPFQADSGETSSTDQYQFDISKFCHLYLIIDAANDMPDHNNNDSYQWQRQTQAVSINGRAMAIYKSRLMRPYENGYFATNGHGINRFDPKSNMYLVAAVSGEQPLIKPGLAVTASSSRKEHLPAAAVDGDAKTRWESQAKTPGEWLKIDLGRDCLVSSYQLDFYHNRGRVVKCKVELSDDDKTYRSSAESGEKAGPLRVGPQDANQGRYVRITMAGDGAAIDEVQISGVPADAAK